MNALVVMLALLQQDEIIPRASKQIYHPAAISCEKAHGMIDTDPREALRLLDEILANPRIEKRECRMRIVLQPGTESKWYEFFPYQFRGRAALKLSESSQGEDKVRLLEQAVSDLQKSAELGLKTSEPLLTGARAKLEPARRALTGAKDPEEPFRRGWTELVDAGRFAEAKAYVAGRGQVLPEAKRLEYDAETTRRCAAAVGHAADRFVAEVGRLESVRALSALRDETFDRDFGLPAKETLVVTGDRYEWCLRMRATLSRLRSGEEASAELFDRAVESIGKVDAGDRLAWSALESAVRGRADQARTAPADRRQVLRAEAEKLVAQWSAFDAKLRAAGRAHPEALKRFPPRDAAALLGEFPADASLDAIVALLDGSVTADDPERALGEAEKALAKLLEQADRLTIESRRRILSLSVAARAVRGILGEEAVEDIVRSARSAGSDLRALGGPVEEVKRYGPKVAEIFDRLR